MKLKLLKKLSVFIGILLSINITFAEMRSSISQYGITWTFDGQHECGQFVTGDWWVVGPVTINAVSPAQTPGRNGSQLNPQAGCAHGYDERAAATCYDASLRVSYPLTVGGVNSLVSTASVTKPTDCETGAGNAGWVSRLGHCDNRSVIQTMAVLTIVNSPVAPGTFRPPFVGNNYKEFNTVSQIDYNILPRLPKPGMTPSTSSITKYMDRPMMDHFNGWTTQIRYAFDNAPGYGATITEDMTEIATTLMFDINESELQLLANYMIQRGIDSYGALRNGVVWPADGGHASGRKLPILIAGKLLNHTDMLNIGHNYGDGAFGEDCQTYFDNQGVARWGIRHCQDPNNPNYNDESDNYRFCCTSSFWGGESVVAQILGLRDEWNHEAFFAYVDRWVAGGGGIKSPTDGYASYLWNTYRWNLPTEIPHSGDGPDENPPSIPTGLTAGTVTGSAISLSWNASTDDKGLAGYKVFTNGANPVNVSGTSTTLTGLNPVTQYSLTVSAYDATGNESAQSTALNVTTTELDTQAPSVPTGLSTGTITTSSVTLNWNVSTDNVGVTSYNVYTNGANPVNVTGTSATINNLSDNTQYSFTVSALDLEGNESAQSSPINATTLELTGVISGTTWQSFTESTQTGAFIATFDAIPSASNIDAVTGIQNGAASAYGDLACIIRFNTYGQIDARNGGAYAATNTVNYTAGISYHFSIEINVLSHTYSVYVTPQGGSQQTVASGFAFRSEQASVSQVTGWSVYAQAGSHAVDNMTFSAGGGGDTEAPSIPASLTAGTTTSSSVDLSWTASTDNVGVTGYKVYTNSANPQTVTGTSVTINGLSPSTQYSFTVSAYDAAGNESAQSTAVIATTLDDSPLTGYYVDPATGSMSNDGSEASPWSTLAEVFTAGKTFQSGDVIYLKNGNHGWPNITQSNSGIVTIKSYPGHNPVINRLDFNNAVNWAIEGVRIYVSTAPPADPVLEHPVYGVWDNYLVRLTQSSNISFDNCYIYSIENSSAWTADDWNYKAWCGISLNNGSHDIAIKNSLLKNLNFAIDMSYSYAHTIQYNTIQNYCGDGMRVSSNCIVEYNNLLDCYQTNGNHADAMQAFASSGAIVRGNKIINTTSDRSFIAYGLQGIGFFDGFFDNYTIENNLVVTHTWHGISLYGARNCKIINNTVVDNPIGASSYGPPWIAVYNHKDGTASSGNIMRNNLTSDINSTAGTSISNNIETTSYTSHFVNYAGLDFRLQPTSSAVDGGTTSSAPTIDLNQYPRSGNPDVGCYELGTTAPTNDSIAPSIPTGLTVGTITASSVALSWNASTDDTGVAGYKVYVNGTNPVISSGTNTVVSNLSGSTTYTFTVSAYDAAGNESAQSSSVNATTLEQTGITSNSTFQSFTLSTQTGTFTAEFDAIPNGSNIDAVTGIQNGIANAYGDMACIIRFNSSGQIDARNGGSYTATNAVNYTGGVNYHFRIEVDVPSHTYSVYATPQGGSEQTVAADFAFRTEQASVSQLTGWSLYAYAGSHSVDNMTFTSAGGDTEAPSVPTGLAAGTITETSVDLSWSASTDNVGVTDYKVYTDGSNPVTVTGTNTTISGLSQATQYSFTVSAIDATGNESAQSAAVQATTLDTQAPSVPTGLAAGTITETSVDLSWSASTDNVGVTGYKVYTDGSNPVTVTGTSVTISSLAESTQYSFTVSAIDAAGNESAQSSAVDVTTLATDGNLALNKPITVSAYQDDEFGYNPGENLVDGDVSDSARWSASGFPQWAEIDLGANYNLSQIDLYPYQNRAYQYIVEAKPAGGSYTVIVDKSANTESADLLVSPVNITARYVKISVSGLYGNASTWVSLSELEVWGSTSEVPDTEAPSVPTGLTTGTITGTSVDLSWSASTDNVGVTGYKVYTDGVNPQTVTSTSASINGLSQATQYSFTVSAIDDAGNESAQSAAVQATTLDTQAPSIPTGLAVGTITGTSVDLSWTASTDNVGVTGYKVYTDGANPQTVTGTSATINGLSQVTQYSFTVSAIDDAGNESAQSAAVQATTLDAQAPSVPTGLTVGTVTETSVALSWNASTDNVGVTGYKVYTDGSNPVTVGGTSITINGLSQATQYSFTVIAIDAAGNESAQSAAVNATTLVADPLLANMVGYWAFDQINGSVTPDGSGNGNNGTVSGATLTTGQISSALSFDGLNDKVSLGNLDVTPSIGNDGISLAAWINPDVWTEYYDNRIISKSTGTSEQDHYWMLSGVKSINKAVLRFRLKTGTVTTTLVADASGEIPVNQWSHVAATYDGSTMKIYLNGNLVGNVAKTGTVATNNSVEATIGVNPDGARPFDGEIDEVYIFDRGLSAQEITDLMTRTSSGSSDTEAPSVPTGLTAGTITETSVTLSWNASIDNVGVTGYKVYTDGSNPVNVAGTSTTISGLSASTQYSFTVSAVDAAGNESAQSSAINVPTTTPDDTEAPSVPTGLTAGTITETSVDLSWSTSTDNVGVTGYKVYTDGLNPVTVAGTSATISGLSPSTQYSFTVSAIDAASNESAQSSAIQVTTATPADTEAPSVPTGLASGTVTETSVDLSWTASTDNVGVTGYKVYTDGLNPVTVAGTSATISGLSPSTQYSITVSALDAASNESAQSAAIQVTTATPPDTEAPSVPTGLAAGTVTSSSVALSWTVSTDNVGVTGYKVYTNGANPQTVTGTSTTINGLSQDTQYSFTVSAIDAAGNESAQSSSISVTTQQAPSGITSSATWQSFGISTETGVFTATFDAVPNGNNIDALTGILNGSASAFGDIACIIRFYTNGQIDARNGDSYEATNVINYASGVSYHFRVEISVSTHTYNVYVTPQGGSEQTVASNFVFRSEQASVSQLTGWTLYAASGSHTVSAMVFTPAPPDTEAPSMPTGLAAGSIYSTGFTLSWTASTDNVGIVIYEVFKDGLSIGTTNSTSMFVNGLSPETTYSMAVKAGDAVPNWSASSSTLNVTTSASGVDDWPTDATTGYSGTLTNYSGDIIASTNGQIIENMNISGKIFIKANNVTIRNCKFSALDIADADNYTGCVVEDSKLSWAGRRNFTLRRCDLSSQSSDLIRVGGPNITIEDCYLHIDGPEIDGTHADIIQEFPVGSGANLIVRHNRCYIAMEQNSTVIGSTDMIFENNLVAGGSYCLNPSNSGTNRIINNHFSTLFYPNCGSYGPFYPYAIATECYGNVWHETGAPFNCPSSGEIELTRNVEQGIKIYPNPLSGNTLKIKINGYDEANIVIYNLIGKIVYNQSHSMVEQTELQISVDNLNKGIYIISVNGNQQKLVVE